MSLTPSKEEDEEDIDYLYRVEKCFFGGCTKTIEVEKIVEVPQKSQIQRGLSHLRDKEYVDELFSGTTNGEGSTSNRDNDL